MIPSSSDEGVDKKKARRVVDLYHEKKALRQMMQMRRRSIAPTEAQNAAKEACRIFCNNMKLKAGQAIAAYVAQNGELDPYPLILAVRERGCHIALPVVSSKRHPLTFRVFVPGDSLVPGYGSIPEPLPYARALSPDIFLVPLLAFDKQGNRLGYGGGLYDRTLELAKSCKQVLAIGMGYACQEIERVPQGLRDVPLDAVLTETNWIAPPVP